MSRQTRRRGEPSYKEVAEEEVNDLITHEENVLNLAGNKLKLGKNASRKVAQENDEDDEDEDMDFIDSQDKNSNGAAEKLQRVYRQLLKNKIKVDNVFDIQWDEKTKLADLDWQSSANFLDTISKVWGIKVEKTHKDTYRILGNLIRSEIQDPDEEQDSSKRLKDNMDLAKVMSRAILQRQNASDSYGAKTLEKNQDNLDVEQYDIEFDVDPLFKKTSAKFDEQGASGLLINNLYMDSNMMLLLESNQSTNGDLKDEEKKEIQNQKALSANLSQECSNYWRLVDTKNIFPKKTGIADRLSAFKKLMQSSEDSTSTIKLAEEVSSKGGLKQLSKGIANHTNAPAAAAVVPQNQPADTQFDYLNELGDVDDVMEAELFGRDAGFGRDDRVGQQTRQKRKSSMGGFIVDDINDESDGKVPDIKEAFIEPMIEEEEIEEKKEKEVIQEEEDEEERKLKLQEKDEEADKVILFSEEKQKENSEDEQGEKPKEGESEGEEEEEIEVEDEDGNVIKRKRIKAIFDFDGIDEKLRTVGRGVHKKFKNQHIVLLKSEDFVNLQDKKGTKGKQKKSKKAGDDGEEEKKFFDFDMKSAEKADVILEKKQKKKMTIKDYVKDAKFLIEDDDHYFLNEKTYSKISECLHLSFSICQNVLDLQASELAELNQEDLAAEQLPGNEDEDSLDINHKFKNTFALNYGSDEDEDENDKIKEQKNNVTIRDLKRKLWENLRSKILENHANFQKQRTSSAKKSNNKEEMEQIQFTGVMHELPKLFGESAKRVSMQSCFITILHLANEQTLKLSNFSGQDFGITKESKADLLQELKRQQELEQQEEKEMQEEEPAEIEIEEEEKQEDPKNQADNVSAGNSKKSSLIKEDTSAKKKTQ